MFCAGVGNGDVFGAGVFEQALPSTMARAAGASERRVGRIRVPWIGVTGSINSLVALPSIEASWYDQLSLYRCNAAGGHAVGPPLTQLQATDECGRLARRIHPPPCSRRARRRTEPRRRAFDGDNERPGLASIARNHEWRERTTRRTDERERHRIRPCRRDCLLRRSDGWLQLDQRRKAGGGNGDLDTISSLGIWERRAERERVVVPRWATGWLKAARVERDGCRDSHARHDGAPAA